MSGLLQDVRFTVSIGSFAVSGQNYAGLVGTVGNNGYSVDDLNAGQILYDGSAIYQIESFSITVAGSVAQIEVSYLSGSENDPQPPSSTRGQITTQTELLGLSLITETGSNYFTPSEIAKIHTHNYLLIDAALTDLPTGGGGQETVTVEVLNYTGATVPVPGVTAASEGVKVYRDATRQASVLYTLGEDIITPTDAQGNPDPSVDQSWIIDIPVGTYIGTTVEVLNHTGATVPVAGMTANTEGVKVYRDGRRQASTLYTLGQGIITPTDPSDDESWIIDF